MKNTSLFLTLLSLVLGSAAHMQADRHSHRAFIQIPEIDSSKIDVTQLEGYEKVADVAQYGEADWNNVLGISHNISLETAKKIADENPAITYFFYMKGWRMVLPSKGRFLQGDAVFFSGTPWWGSAEGFADGYVKQISPN